MKIINVILMLAFTVLVCSLMGCSQSDDEYNSDMYTLAEMGTRLGGEPEGGGGKKKVELDPLPSDLSDPNGLSGNPVPVLYGEYDTESLSVFINDYRGNAQVSVLSVPRHHLMDYAEDSVASTIQFNFPFTDYTEGTAYQIIVMLDNNKMYVGEFERK